MKGAIRSLMTLLIMSMMLTTSKALVPEYDFSLSIDGKTRCLIGGEIDFQGKLLGKEIQSGILPVNLSALENLTDPDLSSIIDYLANSNISVISIISSKISIKDLDRLFVLDIAGREINRFYNVSLDLDDLPILMLGVDDYASLERINYGILSFDNIEISNEEVTALLVISDDMIKVGIRGSPYFVIIPWTTMEGSGNGHASITSDGNDLWQEDTGDWIIVVDDDSIIADSSSTLTSVLFDKPEDMSLEVRRSSNLPNAESMLNNLSTSLSLINHGDMMNLPDFLMSFASPFIKILNGACVLANSNVTITVEGKTEETSNIGLLRFNRAIFSIEVAGGGISLHGKGRSTLLFLGNTVYSNVPTMQVGTIYLPIHSLALWFIAIAIFIIFSVVLKRKGEEKIFGIFPLDIGQREKRMIKRVFLAIHIIFVILTIVLFDSAFSSVFGLSFIDYLSKNTLLSILILSLEITFIAICFVMFGLPTRIGVNTIMNFIGLGKEGKNVGKSLALVVMWLFSFAYITFLSNAMVGLIKDIMMGIAS